MSLDALRDFVRRHSRIFVLSGAGCSTDSGIPDYRDERGEWKRARPVMYQDFMGSASVRQRYWARSLVGWRHFGSARPGPAHHALARLEQLGRLEILVTQNVDRLHQGAGNQRVIDLHGRLDQVRCMACERRSSREELQAQLEAANPEMAQQPSRQAPDGDADLELPASSGFQVPGCRHCGGILKPDVVFFGENVPPARVALAASALARADAMLVVGSSLMVYSGYRFVQAAAASAIAIACVNLGRTRADELLTLKVSTSAAEGLSFLLAPSTDAARQS
jgi:NAD-dependent SIR2 family protein deacetylase